MDGKKASHARIGMNTNPTSSIPQGDVFPKAFRNRFVWGVFGLIFFGIFGVLTLKWFKEAQKEIRRILPIYGQLSDFEFVEQSGKPFGSRDLRGKLWIADFIFTRCAGPCPIMTQKMSKLQSAFQKIPDLKLVSFSVDPEYDSPKVLTEYAKQFHAERAQWVFLTGKTEAVYKLARESFKLSVGKDRDQQTNSENGILHSIHFILVDGVGRIRGYYDSSDPQTHARLLSDAGILSREMGSRK